MQIDLMSRYYSFHLEAMQRRKIDNYHNLCKIIEMKKQFHIIRELFS